MGWGWGWGYTAHNKVKNKKTMMVNRMLNYAGYELIQANSKTGYGNSFKLKVSQVMQTGLSVGVVRVGGIVNISLNYLITHIFT